MQTERLGIELRMADSETTGIREENQEPTEVSEGRIMINFVQSAGQTQTSSVLFGLPNTAGNCIVVFLAAFNTGGGGTPTTVTDTQGNTYTQVGGVQLGANSGNYSQVFIAKNIIGGAANTVSYSPSGFGTLRVMLIAEYTGASKTGPVRSNASMYSSGAGTKTVTLTTVISDLVILETVEMNFLNITPPTGFTHRQGAGSSPGEEDLYDGPAGASGTNPFSVVTTDSGGGSLWGIVLQPQRAGYSYAFEC
jgi:hypothetical protein